MGLDITAVKNCTFIETLESYDEWEEKYFGRSDKNTVYTGGETHDFIEHRGDLRSYSVFEYEKKLVFAAGSYRGYNVWRNWLSETVLGVPAKAVWDNPEKFKEKPFYYLINFSDCEGCIGTEVSKILAGNFGEYQWMIDDAQHVDGWFISQYSNWREAFEMASDNGFVEFH